jgi:predicted nucleotidyltransferase
VTADDDLLVRLRRALSPYAEIRLALLFGSQAKERATSSSDIDLAVHAPGMDLQALAGNLSSELGVEVDVLSLDAATIPLLEALVQDAVVILEGRPGAGAAWRSRTLTQLETDRPFYRRMRDAWLRRVAERGV